MARACDRFLSFPRRLGSHIIPVVEPLSYTLYSLLIHFISYLIKGECVCHCVSVCDYVGSLFECYSQREKVDMRECAH